MKGLALILFTLAIIGMGCGVVLFIYISGSRGIAEAAASAWLPTLIGVVALSGVTVTLAVDEARRDIVSKLGER